MTKEKHRKQIAALLGAADSMFKYPTSFTLADAPQLERCFPSCTAALDGNPRLQQWAGYRFSVHGENTLHVAEDDQAALLIAFRTSEEGSYVRTPSNTYLRHNRYFFECAVYSPSCERWTVIR